jgi:hypothetical protein
VLGKIGLALGRAGIPVLRLGFPGDPGRPLAAELVGEIAPGLLLFFLRCLARTGLPELEPILLSRCNFLVAKSLLMGMDGDVIRIHPNPQLGCIADGDEARFDPQRQQQERNVILQIAQHVAGMFREEPADRPVQHYAGLLQISLRFLVGAFQLIQVAFGIAPLVGSGQPTRLRMCGGNARFSPLGFLQDRNGLAQPDLGGVELLIALATLLAQPADLSQLFFPCRSHRGNPQEGMSVSCSSISFACTAIMFGF